MIGSMPLEELISQLKHSRDNISQLHKSAKNRLRDPDNDRKMTFEDKRNLVLAIGKLSKDKLRKLLDILASESQLVKSVGLVEEEIANDCEVTVDMLTTKTLLNI